MRHETGSSVVMNCASNSNGHRTFLVAGQESHCQLYHVSMEILDNEDIKSNDGNILSSEPYVLGSVGLKYKLRKC